MRPGSVNPASPSSTCNPVLNHALSFTCRYGRSGWKAACPLRSGVVKMRTFVLRGSLAVNGRAAYEGMK